MSDCIFCKIAKGEIPSELLYENQHVVAFKDINPQAPIHLLVIPKEHIPSATDLTAIQIKELIPEIFTAIHHLVKEFNLDSKGYRIVNNCGQFGGQSVTHLHFHILGGQQLQLSLG
ncbi:histidine triad nucleotide-binding protein [Alkaliphilus serpentinus]|uniref:Histidine triad nucleotide-binding protein n=1 Tax=Alkaliphilus serpentinus TaxID=1482731 RepID=A0A833HPJ2_9FIRM|nr:histidine triad nucleotide-binding protein [Alkaliphilus serpentinus]KAB3530753.1 histidine triad nucleotide-binding protein [Alkaliphilus serpentinus]